MRTPYERRQVGRNGKETMTTTEQHEALSERYTRLHRAAQQVVDGCEAVGNGEEPRCGVHPHLIRRLRRELEHEPQPSAFFTMSTT
jgi:hypothetical protein